MKLFFKKITKVEEEDYQDNKGRRKIEIVTLECRHRFWREIDSVSGGEEKICDACLLAYLEQKYETYGKIVFKVWDSKIRKLLI